MELGQGMITRDGRWFGKLLVSFSLLVGLAFAAFLHGVVTGQQAAVEQPASTMFGAQLASRSPSMSQVCMALGPKMSVPAMQASLEKYGIPSSPLTKYALTQFAATRDVSMKAAAREEFKKLDPETQAKLQALSKDVVVRAEGLNRALGVTKNLDGKEITDLKISEMAGATAPLGFFDPLGFSEFYGSKDSTGLYGLRSAELKHSRVCMLAFLGMVVSAGFHPIYDAYNDGPFVSVTATHFTPTIANNFWPAFVTLAGIEDLRTTFQDDPSTLPGDLGFDPLGLRPKDPKEWMEMQNKELNNGRVAIMAVTGIIAAELATGKKVL